MLTFKSVRPVNLVFETNLLGASHSFRHGGSHTVIRLPPMFVNDESAAAGSLTAIAGGWDKNGGVTQISARFVIIETEVTSEDGQQFGLPRKVPSGGDALQAAVNNAEEGVFAVAARQFAAHNDEALGRWSSLLRWKAKNAGLGEPLPAKEMFIGFDDLNFEGNPLRNYSQPITIHVGGRLTSRHWDEVQVALDAELSTPVWIDLFYEAERRRRVSDFKTAFIDTVVATEAFIRSLLREPVAAAFPDSPGLSKRIMSWGMADILQSSQKIKELEPICSDPTGLDLLKKSFSVRNELLHGSNSSLDSELVETLMKYMRPHIIG